MKYLVTGGAGFIGSHLVDRLLKGDNKVVVLDDFSTGKLENLPSSNPKLVICEGSVLSEIDSLFEKVNIVFHLAALNRPQESILRPRDYNFANTDGILNILDNCVTHKIKRLIFVSSSSIYGTQEVFPTSEEASPASLSTYALTKLIGEQYCKMYERIYGLETNYIRPFNVYGSRQDPSGSYGAAVPKFIHTLDNGGTPYITGDGDQNRDYIFVEDVIDLIILASKSKVYGEAFNAGSESNITINNLYKTICEIMGKNTKPKYVPAVLEPRTTLADMSKAKRLLGWKSKVGLREGLERMIKEI